MKSNDPYKSSGHKAGNTKRGTNSGACSGPKMSDEMRSDVTKAPSSKNPYPKGMA